MKARKVSPCRAAFERWAMRAWEMTAKEIRDARKGGTYHGLGFEQDFEAFRSGWNAAQRHVAKTVRP